MFKDLENQLQKYLDDKQDNFQYNFQCKLILESVKYMWHREMKYIYL